MHEYDNAKSVEKKEKTSSKINIRYNRYYYIIVDYVSSYDNYLKQDAVLFAQKMLKEIIKKILDNNEIVTEKKIRQEFIDFDFKFKKDLGNVEIILEDIKNGKSNYAELFFEKYMPYINTILNEIGATKNDKKIFESCLHKIIADYKNGIIHTNYTINSYIFRNIENIKNNIINQKHNFGYMIDLISKGKYEYIYAIYDIYKDQIDNAINNSQYDKTVIENYLNITIYNIVNMFVKGYDISKIDFLKNRLQKIICSIDKIYYYDMKKTFNMDLKATVINAKSGKYESIDDLVQYYKDKLEYKFGYSFVENQIVDEIFTKLLTVDIKSYLYSEKYEYTNSIHKYFNNRIKNYKLILDMYLDRVKSIKIDVEEAIKFAKENKNNIYILYKYYLKIVNKKFINLLPQDKQNDLYKNIICNQLFISIKNYINMAENPNNNDLKEYIYKDFDWFSDMNEINKEKKK